MRVRRFTNEVQVWMGTAAVRYREPLKLAVMNLPMALAAATFLSLTKVPVILGICWENSLRDDVANATRQRILKKLTKLDEFKEMIDEVEPALRDAIARAMGKISQLERSRGFDRTEFSRQQQTIIEMIEKEVWAALEPKIKDAPKRARLRAWVNTLKTQLAEVDQVKRRATEILKKEVREILYDLNGRTEDHFGQTIPGEIEGGRENAMHILAETIVEKIMDTNLDFDVAIKQVVRAMVDQQIIETSGQDQLLEDMLKNSMSVQKLFLAQLFADFRKDYLDMGDGQLHLPQREAEQMLAGSQASAAVAGGAEALRRTDK